MSVSIGKLSVDVLLKDTNYQYAGKLGQGSSGTVLLGYSPRSNEPDDDPLDPRADALEPNAIKVYGIESKATFEREARALETLAGFDNIVRLHRTFATDELCYLVMEECEGDLEGIYLQKGAISEAQSRGIFHQMVYGLIAVHAKQMCHHDVKLTNYLVAKDGQIKLADFGYALDELRDHQHLRQIQSRVYIRGEYTAGTLEYSPLQVLLQRPHIGHLTDIYSLGVCLYRMVCGRFPFGVDSLEDVVRRIRQSRDQSKIYFPEGISSDLKELICGMIAVDECDRWGWERIVLHPWFLASL
eukprot:TRINITY_DN23_c12_g1_i1.p1 TRINITY_DN23_c12_g1~~TRINITY_DN23_c12_g1_i1.p1  ORF type:complete len:300 (+),score=83.80 TRINITY_DN23_c12_g1_i1:173-1072(+)